MADQKGRDLLEQTLHHVAHGGAGQASGSEQMLAALAYARLVDGSTPPQMRTYIMEGLRRIGGAEK